jgi:hypothetical protein
MKIENIMEKMEEYLNEYTFQLVLSVEDEEYELAAEIRDDIEKKLDQLTDILLKYNLTKLDSITLKDQLKKRKELYITDWYNILSVPDERRAQYI